MENLKNTTTPPADTNTVPPAVPAQPVTPAPTQPPAAPAITKGGHYLSKALILTLVAINIILVLYIAVMMITNK